MKITLIALLSLTGSGLVFADEPPATHIHGKVFKNLNGEPAFGVTWFDRVAIADIRIVLDKLTVEPEVFKYRADLTKAVNFNLVTPKLPVNCLAKLDGGLLNPIATSIIGLTLQGTACKEILGSLKASDISFELENVPADSNILLPKIIFTIDPECDPTHESCSNLN